jgi:Poly(ADP-ribose) polymerase catalytic domain.
MDPRARCEVVHAFRSEHVELWRRYDQRRQEIVSPVETLNVKTRAGGAAVNERLGPTEAYLFHGTNPSSSMSILQSGFSLSHTGKSAGSMYGSGLYLAECSSKSDEYTRDDGGNAFPGLRAFLVCRCAVGRAHVVHKAGDHVLDAKATGYDCVLGDRESVVGTYREFIFSDERQVWPEFAVIYKRVYDQSKVPQEMQQRTSGTTGRNWQAGTPEKWKFDRGVSPRVFRGRFRGNFRGSFRGTFRGQSEESPQGHSEIYYRGGF